MIDAAGGSSDFAESAEIELRAQINRALAMGLHPTHLDSHMGTLFAKPEFLDKYVQLGIEKQIPVASGLGGGSSDTAAALRLANETLAEPLPADRLHLIAVGIGADVPFFLAQGPQLGDGDGTELSALDVPQDFWVVLVLPNGVEKRSTAEVYEAFDGVGGFEERTAELRKTLAGLQRPGDLAALPPNDLASSPLADELRELGAFRADVTGAGPAVYGLFLRRDRAEAARRALAAHGRTWLTVPAWYG